MRYTDIIEKDIQSFLLKETGSHQQYYPYFTCVDIEQVKRIRSALNQLDAGFDPFQKIKELREWMQWILGAVDWEKHNVPYDKRKAYCDEAYKNAEWDRLTYEPHLVVGPQEDAFKEINIGPEPKK